MVVNNVYNNDLDIGHKNNHYHDDKPEHTELFLETVLILVILSLGDFNMMNIFIQL